MSEHSLPYAKDPFAEPVLPSSNGIDFDRLLDNAPVKTDESPTCITKGVPTQTYVAPGGDPAAMGGSVRGRKLAHFELLEPIGVGGMAAVLRARDMQLDRFVALKILPPDMAADPEHVERFHQEARAAAKLDHENIARVYFCGEDQKLHFIAFEFVEGQNLRTLLEQQGKVSVPDGIHYMLQIAAGLAHAAARGVVHRDIKPSNIIITPGGRAKLVDMGLARSHGQQDKRQLTQSGVTLGTFDYISPEQALEPRDADVRSDIYSLGCTFYHLLTGQPPVPEGTAARKLHHHQHVAPIDPRQLNPAIPDEIAMILQRMMAKNPRDRYQRAEHLVQNLVEVAQKTGGVDVPASGIFLDAPLPSPPQKRPLVLAAIAVAVLGIFVLAVAVTTPRSQSVTPRPSKPLPQDNVLPGKLPGVGGTKDLPIGDDTRRVSTEEEWNQALAEDRPLKIILQKDLRFNEPTGPYRGGSKRSLIVESDDPKKPKTLHFVYSSESENPTQFWAGLAIEGGTVDFRNICFVIEAKHTPRQLAAAVVVTGGQVTFERCAFGQNVPPAEDGLIARRASMVPIASVAAWKPTLERPPLIFRNCYFSSGQAAVSVYGSAHIIQSNCAYGPHACLFHLWGQDKDDKTELFLSNISAQVAQGPAFRLDDNVNCVLGVQHSIFSCPDNASSRDQPDLIRETGVTRAVKYEGKRNAYHQLESYWRKPSGKDEPEGADWKGFKDRLKATGGSDVGSSQLKVSPWAKSNVGPEDEPKTAFLIDDKLPELRQKNDEKRAIGVQDICAWGPLYPAAGLPPVDGSRPGDTAFKLGPKQRLVDPSGTVKGDARVHKKIEAALIEAEQDDVILIKYHGEITIDPTVLTDNRRVKLKPYGDYKPILVLGKTTEKTASLIQLHHSQIEFEQLEFLLRPDAHHRSVSIVSLGAESVCRFKQCVITLDSADFPAAEMDVVTLLDLHDSIKMPASGAHAEVKFETCFVRGRGDLVDVRASRPFELDLEGSLISLEGSLLSVHPHNG
ncbi:MAG TPA: serine/threonine-protein kinase, partial [Gemmataceae bacterium]|nr:serine/threonine-protein kinase [Gemmataceae bacterium]